jgi:hypothetical protein
VIEAVNNLASVVESLTDQVDPTTNAVTVDISIDRQPERAPKVRSAFATSGQVR